MKAGKIVAVSMGVLTLLSVPIVAALSAAAIYDHYNAANKPLSVEQEQITPDSLFVAINGTRTKNGIAPLSRDTSLDRSASLKCSDMSTYDYYAHTNPKTGKHGYSFADDVGVSYKYVSENLNLGNFANTSEVIDSWMNSPAHKAAILDPKYQTTGFAVCTLPSYPGYTAQVEHFVEPQEARQQTTVNNYVAPSTQIPHTTTTKCNNDYINGGVYCYSN